MSEKPGKEELLDALLKFQLRFSESEDRLGKADSEYYEQAYNQLKEIVGEHFVHEKTIDMMDGILCELREENKRLKQQKPRVSREYMEMAFHIDSEDMQFLCNYLRNSGVVVE